MLALIHPLLSICVSHEVYVALINGGDILRALHHNKRRKVAVEDQAYLRYLAAHNTM